jgi:hypothetical protein
MNSNETTQFNLILFNFELRKEQDKEVESKEKFLFQKIHD